ncbi:MAG TPA: hypothetical protein PK597_05345 [Oscillospiraceae bacterium]|nr:hypothetical protein [Oscillospiraceae bacterium]
MTKEEGIARLRAEASALDRRRRELSQTLKVGASSARPRGILDALFGQGVHQKPDRAQARIAALQKQAALYLQRISALEAGPETLPLPASEMVADAGRAALGYLDAAEANVREMEWNGTGTPARQKLGRIENQRLAQENAASLLPLLNLFYAGFAQLTGEPADLLTLLDWYFEGLFVGVTVFDGTEEAKEAITFGRDRLTEDIRRLSAL